jgi:heptosyltransferase-2
MAACLWALRARSSVGRRSGGRAIGFDLTSKTEGHETDAQLGVARLVGASPTSDLPELWVTNEDRLVCASLLERHGVPESDQVVCLHAGAAQPEKLWPRENFAVVGRRLAGAGARVMLIGTDGERGLCNSLAQAIPRAISLAGETSLPVLAALLQRSGLLVTNDSGPMHMAAALGVPLVVPFGPGPPDRFRPRGRATCVIFAPTQEPVGLAWWERIPTQAVSDAALHLLAEASARSKASGGDP